MHVCGIITEYNPFHLGHAHQLAQLRARFGADTAVVCAMSGNFVQRGDFALLRKHARAEAALAAGVDLVLELPVPWALSSAEGFARGGVDVLTSSGVVTTLAFGSECGDTAAILRAASLLDAPDYAAALHGQLARGTSFAAAREAAVQSLDGGAHAVLSRPNDNLGVEYCRALAHFQSPLTPLALPRVGAAHDAAPADGGFASASYLRALALRGDDISAHVPPDTARILAHEAAASRAPVSIAEAERAILARLRSLTADEFAACDSGNEGHARRLFAAARTACSLDELFAAAKTRRVAHARLRRVALRAYLGLPAALAPRVPYLRVLGFTARGRALLHAMKSAASLPILTKPADVRLLPAEAQHLFALEARATDLYSLAYPSLAAARGGTEWTTGPVIL